MLSLNHYLPEPPMPPPDNSARSIVNDPDATHSLADPGVTTGGEVTRTADTSAASSAGRYVLVNEIARGGMGEVYRANDTILDRAVAVKVLQERLGSASGAASRFADEARITGQLQHPAIPPVHDLGTLPDGRPFLAMKLIEGQTLDFQLRERSDLSADRTRFVSAFEQVCQAVAYAHAHSVIHRDLKPANVMVGEFGEVQVMDWGLAKVLNDCAAQQAAAPEPPEIETDPEQTTDHHAAGASTDDRTRAGEALGTPAYMPPEQARGEIDRVNRRSDVFALGGVLCAILTGKPPYTGASSPEVVGKAASAHLHDALERLERCGADAELINLCKRCLAPAPTDRPADAGEVAALVSAYRAGVEGRLRAAERDRATAATQEIEQRKRRRVWLGSAATLVVAVVAGLAAILVVQRQAAAELGKKNDELGTKNDDLVEANTKTVAALGRAETREQVAVDAVEGYRKAIADNPALRDDPQFADLRAALLTAPAAFCERLRDDLRADPAADARSSARLANVLYQLGTLRHVIGRKADAMAALTEADELLTRSGVEEHWQLTASVLQLKGDTQESLADFAGALVTYARAEAILAARLQGKPDDAVALTQLAKVMSSRARVLSRTKRRDEMLFVTGEAAGKAAEAARLAPDAPEVHRVSFQIALDAAREYEVLKRPDEALRSSEEARAALERYRVRANDPEEVLSWESELVRLRATIYEQMGNTAGLREARERVVEIRRDLLARRLSNIVYRAKLAEALVELGTHFRHTGLTEDDLRALREGRLICEAILRADRSEASAPVLETLMLSWNIEGTTQYTAGRPEDAIAAFREVSRLHEGRVARGSTTVSSIAHFAGNEYNLGFLLSDAGHVDEAMAAYRRSLDLRRGLVRDQPGSPEYRLHVAFTLGNMGTCVFPTDLPAAEGYYREAVEILAELAPKYPKVVAIRDGLPRNRASLAGALFSQGKLDESLSLYQENLRSNPKDESAQKEVSRVVQARELLPRLPDILSGAARPASPAEIADFAQLCTERFQKRYAAAFRLYVEAFAADPEMAANYRVAAAGAAGRAARGDGLDAPSDAAERAVLRAQALNWMRAELASCRKQAPSWSAAERKQAAGELASWLKVSTLSGLRPGLVRIAMPEIERAAWDLFWSDVRAVLADARKPAPPLEPAPLPRAK